MLGADLVFNFGIPSVTSNIGYMVGLLALWRIYIVLRMHAKRPNNLPIKYRSFALGRCFFNFDFILDAPSMIFQAYHDLGKTSFAMPALTEYQVLACSDLDAVAVCESPETQLSFHAAMTDRLKHKYTMFGFEHNNIDPHNSVAGRTIKVLLRTHLSQLRPILRTRIKEGFEIELNKSMETSNGEWNSVSAFALSRRVTERVNSQVFLGTELANSPSFMKSAVRYSHDAIVAAEICRQLPSIFSPIIAPLVMRWSGAMKAVAVQIRKVVKQRLHEMETRTSSPSKHLDCVQWVIESSHTKAQRTVERLVQQVGAVFFASSHQMPMALVYAIYSMCAHPEYVEMLRFEASNVSDWDAEDIFKQMPFLDAFLRESARLNPLDALSIQRKVLVPLKLPSGAIVPAGNLIAVPQHAVLRNAELYPDPDCFNPYRYFPNQEHLRHKDAKTKYTDVNAAYPYWGSTKKPCPGRWYVSETLKLALIHLFTNYDFKLADEEAPRSFFWTTAMVPRLSTQILLRKRECAS